MTARLRFSCRSVPSVTLAALLLLVASVASAQSLQGRVAAAVRAMDLGRASLSLHVADVSGDGELASYNSDLALIPASNMKLVTTAAAIVGLGEDFVFHTDLRLDGKTLIIEGDGDPAFGDPEVLEALGMSVDGLLESWVEAVKQAGIAELDAIVVDDRIFDQDFVHDGWPKNQLHKWYCAQVAGLNFNDNCLNIYASPTRPGATPKIVLEPAHAAVLIDNSAVSGDKNAFWAARRIGTNEFVLRGEVKHTLIEPVYVTVDDPPMFFARTLGRMLEQAGVTAEEVRRPLPDEHLADGQLLASVQTTLPTVLLRCNRDSQNLFAEALMKRIGHRVTGQPGTWQNGAAGVRMFLNRVLGSDAASIAIDDGSGMSRGNRISASAITRLLGWMARQDRYADVYLSSLAVPGGKGTLDNRFRGVDLVGSVHAKSGYLNGVVALSGYLVYADGRTIAFSMLLNNYTKGVGRAKRAMENIVSEIDAYIARESAVELGG